MQNNFELPILITPQSFYWCKIWTMIMHLGAGVFMLISALPWFWKIPLLVPIVYGYFLMSGKYCHAQHPDSVLQIYFNDTDEWWLTTAAGNTAQAQLVTPCFVHPWLVVLSFKSGSWWKRYHVILTPVSADADSLRRLRVRLRFPRHDSAVTPANN